MYYIAVANACIARSPHICQMSEGDEEEGKRLLTAASSSFSSFVEVRELWLLLAPGLILAPSPFTFFL